MIPEIIVAAVVGITIFIALFGRGHRCGYCDGKLKRTNVGGWSEEYGHWDFYRCSQCNNRYRISERWRHES